MPRDPSGNFTLVAGNPVVPGTTIEASWANPTMDDIAAALTDSLSRTGQGGLQGPLKVADGSEAAPGVGFNLEPSTGMYRAAAGQLALSTLGTERFNLSATAAAIKTALTVTPGDDRVALRIDSILGLTANHLEIALDGTLVVTIPPDGTPAADTDLVRKKEADLIEADVATNAGNIAQNASDLAAHEGDLANPHGVTAEQTGAYTEAETDAAIAAAIAAIPASELLHVRNQVPSGQAGGATVANTWTERILQTVITNDIAGASLAGNLITLPAGTYMISAEGEIDEGSLSGVWHQHRLRQRSGTPVTLVLGSTGYHTGNYAARDGSVHGRFTLAQEETLALEYWVNLGEGNGQGRPGADNGEPNVFCDVRIWKEA